MYIYELMVYIKREGYVKRGYNVGGELIRGYVMYIQERYLLKGNAEEGYLLRGCVEGGGFTKRVRT